MARILIVEDEAALAETLAYNIREEGHEVVLASDGLQGLDLARAQHPDLVILDLMLPKMDGFKVCRLLKFDERFKRIPIIIFSARSQQEDVALARETGAECYMVKPFDGSALLERIKELIADSAPGPSVTQKNQEVAK